jgi:cephalosporin hydroxylase
LKGVKLYNAEEFLIWRKEKAEDYESDQRYLETGTDWLNNAVRLDYSYMFEWLGIPVIQFPSDLLLIQEAMVSAKVNKVIEVGIARGGTTNFLASILDLMGNTSCPNVIGVDISISEHTSSAIKNSKFEERIALIEGDSISTSTFQKVLNLVNSNDRVMVILDSNHTMSHVYNELNLYSKIVSTGSYLVVMDTAIEYIDPNSISKEKPWGRGNSPMTAVNKFLNENVERFIIDRKFDSRSFPGAAKGGFLRRLL